jgi:hypothetical protein
MSDLIEEFSILSKVPKDTFFESNINKDIPLLKEGDVFIAVFKKNYKKDRKNKNPSAFLNESDLTFEIMIMLEKEVEEFLLSKFKILKCLGKNKKIEKIIYASSNKIITNSTDPKEQKWSKWEPCYDSLFAVKKLSL